MGRKSIVWRAVMFVLLIALPLHASARCKYDVNKDDHVKSKLVTAATMWKGMGLHLGNLQGEFYFLLYMQSLGKRAEFTRQTPLELTFVDGETISVSPLEPGTTRRTMLGLALNNRKSKTFFEVDRAVFEQVRAQQIAKVTVNYNVSDGPTSHEFKFGKGNGGKMMQFAGCVLDNVDTPAIQSDSVK